MPRATARRVIKTDDDELEALNTVNDTMTLESLEATKEQVQVMIQRASIGNAYADEIKYGQQTRSQQSTSNYHIRPACDRQGTKEAEIANQHKPKLTGWSNFHLEVPVPDFPTGDTVRDPHGHRHQVRQELREQAVNLGLESTQELTLDNTYGHRGSGGGRRPSKKAAAPYAKPSHPYLRPAPKKAATSKSSAPQKGITKGKGGKVEQSRPWPPPALIGTPALAIKGKANKSPAKMPTEKLSKMPPTPVRPTAQAKVRPATTQGSSFLLSDPTDFLSKMKALEQKTAEKNKQATTQAAVAQVAVAAPAVVAPATLAAVATPSLSHSSIVRIPVTEFSFPASSAFGVGDISTHTDGIPSPKTFSGFSAFTGTNEPVSNPARSPTSDLIGLGIGNVEMSDAPTFQGIDESSTGPAQTLTLSPIGSLIDSPILDDVKVDVLAADPGGILDIAGGKYVALDDLLMLRDAIESKIKAAMASDDTEASPSTIVREPAVPEVAQPTLGSSATSSVTVTAPVQRRPTNPFTVREPLMNNDANKPSTAAIPLDAKNITTVPEPVKASVTTRAKPFTSDETIASKWGTLPPPPVRGTHTRFDVTDDSKSTRAPPSRLAQSTFSTSNKMADSNLGNAPPSEASALSVKRPRSPLFGDSKVLSGQVSRFGFPPKRPDTKRQYLAPGPGFHQLLADLKISDGEKKK